MAAALGVSAAFLSAVETGCKTTPGSLVEKITRVFQLSPVEKADLEKLAQISKRTIKFDLFKATVEARAFISNLAERFKDLAHHAFARLQQALIKETI